MATVYKNVRGRPIQKFIAQLDVVQTKMLEHAFEIEALADANLSMHHVEHVAHIEVTHGKIDWYVSLVDSNITNEEGPNNNSALSIEFGRAGYIDPTTGQTWGEMDGLYVLTDAVGLHRRGKRVPRIRKKMPRNKKGRFIRGRRS